ncbi:MAG TPA: tetratricopeptide repeat protein [Terriglobales bacterium]|nr:tetratricopeptide repeat protein [Terriglobales bacterium]
MGSGPAIRARTSRFSKFVAGLLITLFVSAVYLYGFPTANVFYAAVVLLHAGLGVLASFFLVPRIPSSLRQGSWVARLGWLMLTVGAVLGLMLVYTGTSRPQWKLLYAHIGLMVVGCALLVADWLVRRTSEPANPGIQLGRVVGVLVCAGLLSIGAWYMRTVRWQRMASNRIQNPQLPPDSMDGEGDGPNGRFFPSSAQTRHRGLIPSKYFMESDACQRCHQDIFNQWNSSAHHFSSFNNQWYRKSVEYMQDVVGVRPSKWCAGCHDPALLYSGMFDTPIKQIVNRPEAQAGLGCMMCHSIVEVKSSMGQGDFYLAYPKLHELAASRNPIVRALHDFTIKLNPEPHRRVFLKPFMREQTAEFCSSCHKVHLDVPVNSYRWIRGFNEYDNWQASGVSGQGARSFYYPPKPQQCADCHMPFERSHDFANIDGYVHSHRFPAANMAVPTANQDQAQLQLTEKFLKDKAVTVDIFAISPAAPRAAGEGGSQNEVASTFAVGEEGELGAKAAGIEASPVTAPLNRVNASVRRGDDVRVDVVVRTRKVGHFFPGGTVDAYDTWVELKAVDDRGQVLFWSGAVEDDGRGPVEKGAHFYRSLQIDAHGNPINKRNAWSTRSVVYVRLVPPGAADTVHYRLHVPDNAGSKIQLRARLCYRKFAWWNTHFAFAGVYDEQQKEAKYSSDFDDRMQVFRGDTSIVSGKLKEVPNLPIVEMSSSEAILQVLAKGAKAPEPTTVLSADDWTRWNDYGIGLLLQGDLKGAQAAFRKITEIDPKNPDGWVNLGRVAVQEGDNDRAREVLEKALALKPDLARTNFFYARVLKNEGQYDQAVAHLETVLAQYPRDRVARNDLGRLYFLKRQYNDAIRELQNVLSVDPEDLQAHYNLMLCYQGLGNDEMARRHRRLYERFKADESAQAITGAYRQKHPEDNLERQSVHEHVSIPLSQLARYDSTVARQPSKPSIGSKTVTHKQAKPVMAAGRQGL